MKMRSLLCMLLAAIIMLPSASMTVFAQTTEDSAGIGASVDLNVPKPTESPEIISISAGSTMSAAVRADGSLWTWGGEELKRSGAVWGNHWSVDKQIEGLGVAVGEYVNNTPVMALSKSTKSVKCSYNKSDTDISSASNTPMPVGVTMVLKDDNSLWVWGGGCHGVLGDGDSSQRHTLWQPYKILEDVVSYDTSGYHSAAVTSDGSLYMWGYNCYGQLGNNSTEDLLYPTKIMDDVSSVSLGSYFSGAIKKDGSLWLWGRNSKGQLGDGTTDDSFAPKRIDSNVQKVSLGDSFTAILKTDGTVWTCGNNDCGQLGNGTIGTNRNTLGKVVDIDDVVIDLDTGINNIGAVTYNNVLYMWGANYNSKLGNGSNSHQPDPIIILRDTKLVSVGYDHTVAIKADGTLWTWGGNYSGQLGNHTTETQNRPAEIQLGSINAEFFVNDIGKKTVGLFWDDNYLNKNSSFYNKNLAVDGIVLSEAAYSNSNVLKQFGFKTVSNGQENNAVDTPGYLIGYKVMYNYDEPTIEIVIAIRGTKSLLSLDALTDAKSVGDGFDSPTNYVYDKLKEVRSIVSKKLGDMGLSSSKKNTKYFLVGHSLGGACAGKLALKMGNDGVGYPQNIYAYTFAAPNYTNLASKLDTVVDVPGVFNLVHDKDLVPLVPKEMVYFWPLAYSLYKAGQTFSLSTNDNSSTFNTVIKTLYSGEIPWDTYMTYKAHMTSTYLALIIASTQNTAIDYTTKGFRIITVHCPVDIEVYDSDNELCAASSGETVIYPKPSAVRITVIGDEKFVELPDDSFTVKYIGTDTGSMKIEDQRRNTVTNEIEQEKTFNDVVLESGKLFASEIDAVDDTENTKLYVIDDEGDKTHSVDNNGKETKLALYELDPQKVHVTAADQQYDGTEKTAKVTVDGLTEGEGYRVIYKNNIEVGTASVSVKGINLYEGRVTETFDIYDNGDLGEDIQWSLSSDGTLTVNGRGSINDFGTDNENTAPWKKHAAGITKLVLGEGIKTIGNNAFSDITELTEAHIPSTVTAISESAFLGSENVVIYGSSDSYAVTYAKEQGLSYVCTDIPVFILGDTDGDNNVTITDATMIQKYLAEYDVSKTFIIEAADTDGDGRITISDVTEIQRYLAELDVPEGIGKVIV